MKRRWLGIVLLILGVVLFAEVLFFFFLRNMFNAPNPVLITKPNISTSKELEVSGWVAWWKEKEAYTIIDKYHDKLKTISPVWLHVNEKFQLIEVGESDKKEVVSKLKSYGLRVIPSLGTEITADQLSTLLNDEAKTNEFIDSVISKLIDLKVDGLDVDLEEIKSSDKDAFTLFIEKLSKKVKANNLTFSITLYAQTGEKDWAGAKVQDLEKLAKLSDEVRIMTYDNHGTATGPGAITPNSWLRDVISYNLKKVDKSKLVIGLPSYGYIWEEGKKAKGLQYDEFIDYVSKTQPKISRDAESGEQVYTEDNYTGWVSDSRAMQQKISTVQSMGLDRIFIWNLGGMDEQFFEK